LITNAPVLNLAVLANPRAGVLPARQWKRIGMMAMSLVLFSIAPLARASTVFSTLAAAGPGNFAVLGLQNTFVNLSLVTINGNAGVSAGGTLDIMAPSVINGNVFKDPLATVTGPGSIHGSIFSPGMSGLDAAVTSASSQAAALAPNLAFSGITSATTVTGNGGTTVVDVNGNISLNNANLNLSGGPNDFFIINVTGSLSLVGTAFLGVTGTPLNHVLYNFTGSGITLNTHVGDVLNGIILVDHGGSSSLDGSFNGEIIYGGKSVSLLSGALVTETAAPSVPEPSTLLLMASGFTLLCIGLFRRKSSVSLKALRTR